MSKYNLNATHQDWERMYEIAKEHGIDVKILKKSQSYDSSCYYVYAEIKNKTGLSLKEVMNKYPLYIADGAIKAVIN